MLPQLPLHPTAQQVQEPPPGPSRPPLYSPVKQSKRRGDAPPIAGPLRLDTLGLPWHRPLFPQQAKVGGGITPCFGGRTGGDLPAGRGVGAPPSGSNKGACGRLPRGEGQSRPCWGGPYTTRGRGGGGKASPTTQKPPQPFPQSPPLSAHARQLQHHGQHRERCGSAGRPCPRRGARSHAPSAWGTRHTPKPPRTLLLPTPTSILSPLFSRENSSRSLRSSAASPSPPSRRWEGHHSPSPIFTAASVFRSAAPSWGRRRGRGAAGSGAGRVQAASPWN